MTLFTPDAEPGHPYWWDHVTWPELKGPLPDSADLVVVGAGYTGLSAAIAAHDAGASVVVVDSREPGKGASTRNGGMVGAHPRLGWNILAKRYGSNVADALFAEAATALDWVKELIKVEEIDCDFQETGRIQLAYTHSQLEAQKAVARQVTEKGSVPCHWLSRCEISNEIATPIYKGGIVFQNHGGLHPARYLLGLLNAVLRRGIRVVSNCPVERLDAAGVGFEIATPLGSISADKVVLATNGYSGARFPWFARRVFPVPSYLIATEPLPPDQLAKLAPGKRMMVETRSRHSYYRISPDGSRIIFGGRAAIVDIDLPLAARRLRKTMGEIWPELSAVRLSHVWSGYTGYTFGHMPHVGEQGGVNYAMGYSGGGTVLAPWLGRKAALRALGEADGETAFSETSILPRWYYHGGKPLFLEAANLWYRHWVDRRENLAARN